MFGQEIYSIAMTPETSSERDERRAIVGWWSAWLLILVLSSAIPYLHWRYDVAEIIETLRSPFMGLRPATLTAFSGCGEIATYTLVFVGFCGVWAWRQPERLRYIILFAAIAALVSNVANAMLASRYVIVFISSEAKKTAQEQIRLNSERSRPHENTEPDKKK